MNDKVSHRVDGSASTGEKTTPPTWEAPAIVWEHAFVALAQVSEPDCIPGQDPRCTP